MKKITPTIQLLILFSVIIVVLLGFHFVAFSFIRNAGIEVSTLEEHVNSLRAQVVEFSKYSPDDMRNLARKVNARIISRTTIAAFIQDIETKGKMNGVQVTIRSADVQSRTGDPADYLEVVRLRIEANGSWSSMMRFLGYLEHVPYKVSLQSFNVSRVTEEASAVPKWKGEIQITSLKLK